MQSHPSAGFERTKRDVIRVVHIGASTLSKRVTEFAGTSASSYTFDDFEVRCRMIGYRSGFGLGFRRAPWLVPALMCQLKLLEL